jgi:hypothetical protein
MIMAASCARALPGRRLTVPGDPNLLIGPRGASGAADAARARKRADEALERVRERLQAAGRGVGTPRVPANAADSDGRFTPSGAVGTSSSLTFDPAVDSGGGHARPTGHASETDTSPPTGREARPAAAWRAYALWTLIVIIAALFCWTMVTLLAHAGNKANNVRD